MTKLTDKSKSELSDAMFGLPEQRKYPMPDKGHARNALARASMEYGKGTLSAGEHDRIVAHAHKMLNG